MSTFSAPTQYALFGAAGCCLAAAILLNVQFLNLAFPRGTLFCRFTIFASAQKLQAPATISIFSGITQHGQS
jgi:hypothetical protein